LGDIAVGIVGIIPSGVGKDACICSLSDFADDLRNAGRFVGILRFVVVAQAVVEGVGISKVEIYGAEGGSAEVVVNRVNGAEDGRRLQFYFLQVSGGGTVGEGVVVVIPSGTGGGGVVVGMIERRNAGLVVVIHGRAVFVGIALGIVGIGADELSFIIVAIEGGFSGFVIGDGGKISICVVGIGIDGFKRAAGAGVVLHLGDPIQLVITVFDLMTVAVGESIQLSVIGGIGIACQGAGVDGDGGAVAPGVVGKGVGSRRGGNGTQATERASTKVRTLNRLLSYFMLRERRSLFVLAPRDINNSVN